MSSARSVVLAVVILTVAWNNGKFVLLELQVKSCYKFYLTVNSLMCYQCVSPVNWEHCIFHATVQNCSTVPKLANYTEDNIACGRFTVATTKGPDFARVHIARCVPSASNQTDCRGVGLLPGVESDVTECQKCTADLCNDYLNVTTSGEAN